VHRIPRHTSVPRCIKCLSRINYDRCHRLNKTCTSSSSVRKRGTKSTSSAKRSLLEDRLEEVVSLLQTQQAASTTASPNNGSIPTPISPDNEVASEELTDLDLLKFRDEHLKDLPFLLLPQGMNANQFRAEKPILSLAIHTICTKAISRQVRLSKQLRETLALKIIANGERSLDLLLSTIVCLAW
jgi:hypothetical protein